MKRRTRKRDPSPAKKPGQNPAGPAEHVAEPPAAVYGEAERQAVGANSVVAHAETESTEISIELQREIENFTNSFRVQRASGTPPAPGEFAAAEEAPARSGAPVARPTLQTAAGRRANPGYAFRAASAVRCAAPRRLLTAGIRA